MGVVARGVKPGGSLTRGMQGPHSTASYGDGRRKCIWDVARDAQKVGKVGWPMHDLLVSYNCHPTSFGATAANQLTARQWRRPSTGTIIGVGGDGGKGYGRNRGASRDRSASSASRRREHTGDKGGGRGDGKGGFGGRGYGCGYGRYGGDYRRDGDRNPYQERQERHARSGRQ